MVTPVCYPVHFCAAEVKEMTDTIHERSLILNAKESLNLVKQRLLVLQKAVDDSLCLVDKRASISISFISFFLITD